MNSVCCLYRRSIGDSFNSTGSTKDTFLPDQTTRSLAEQTNACLQDAVRRDGKAYVQHLDGFIVALREELDSPGGLSARNPPAIERTPYRMDVKQDGTGIESPGWFRASSDMKQRDDDSMVMSRLCALHWVIVLYESVVPDILMADVSLIAFAPRTYSFSAHLTLLSVHSMQGNLSLPSFINWLMIYQRQSCTRVSKSWPKLLFPSQAKTPVAR